MGNLVPVLIAGGGIAYVLTQDDGASVPPVMAPQSLQLDSGGAPIKKAMQLLQAQPRLNKIIGNLTAGTTATYAKDPARQSGWGYNSNSTDPELQQKLDMLESAAKEQFQNANDVAKVKMADQLNKDLKLDPPLTGHESWEDVASVVGGAVGGAAGTALCGPVCGAVGAYAGAILGVAIEDYISKNADEAKEWLEKKWGWVEGKAGDAWNWVAEKF